MTQNLERYRPFIPDWSRFREAISTPLPACVWKHPLRGNPEHLVSRLRDHGFQPQPLGWYPGAWRLSAAAHLGNTLEYRAGLFHVQEEIALLPARLLAPKPGETVLDLCAAPGNKTAQLALMMGLQGLVVANDYNPERLRALRRLIARLGLLNVAVTRHDGSAFPRQTFLFDRVLVDVPCSCEGTSRKNPEVLLRSRDYETLQARQIQLLRRALLLCRVGGRVVYSTCTYAPEENEGVVDAALREAKTNVSADIISVTTPGLESTPGLSEWQGRGFCDDMRNAIRIYPHQNDTGGFFIAVLQKTADRRSRHRAVRETQAVSATRRAGAGVEEIKGWLAPRFGLGRELLDEFRYIRANRKTVGITNLARHELGGGIEALGLPLVRTSMTPPKITTAAAMFFGEKITRNLIDLQSGQVDAYFRQEEFVLAERQLDRVDGAGHVIVRYEGIVLGVGALRRASSGWQLNSFYPNPWLLHDSATAID